jgi:hypothetical protein
MTFDAGRPLGPVAPHRPLGTAELVAALPYLLGFRPTDSVALVGTSATGSVPLVEFTLRVDLPPPAEVAELAAELGEVVAAQGCDGVLLVVVGGGAGPGPEPPRVDVVEALAGVCSAAGAPAWARLWVAEVAAGVPWRCYCPRGCSGELPDPASSPVAVAAVLAGRVTYADRAELERLVAPAETAALARRAALLRRSAVHPVVPGPDALTELAGWVAHAEDRSPELSDDQVVRLCLMLRDQLLRDAAFGFAFGVSARAAERLWSALVRAAPDPDAAEAAVLLAHSALARGDGVLAGMALTRAQRARPGHRLSGMIQSALAAGCHPDELLAWFVEGTQRATELLAERRAR